MFQSVNRAYFLDLLLVWTFPTFVPVVFLTPVLFYVITVPASTTADVINYISPMLPYITYTEFTNFLYSTSY